MRTVCRVFLAFSLAFPSLLAAEFQAPAQDEPKMTAAPKAPGAEYRDLHDFYQKVAAIDQQQIVLTRAAGAKGD